MIYKLKKRGDYDFGQSNELVFYTQLFAVLSGGISDLTASPSKDRIAGLQYALSTLEEDEQRILQLRYQEQQTLQEISVRMERSEEDICTLEKEALRKLCLPSRWNYIRFGIAGYIRTRIHEE